MSTASLKVACIVSRCYLLCMGNNAWVIHVNSIYEQTACSITSLNRSFLFTLSSRPPCIEAEGSDSSEVTLYITKADINWQDNELPDKRGILTNDGIQSKGMQLAGDA